MGFILVGLYLSGCQDSSVSTSEQTDDEYLQTTAIQSAFSNDEDDEDNLMASEITDYESEGPVEDYTGATPIDSLLMWGQVISNVNINTNISNIGDSLKQVEVTRTVTGELIILYSTNGSIDTVRKPFTREQKRFVSFKKIGNHPNPRFRWRVYEVSAADGQTTSPMIGKDNIVMSKVEIYKNGNLELTLNGPDFTSNKYLTRLFGGEGILKVRLGDQVNLKVYLTSNQADKDIVLFHWPKNPHRFHRVRFEMTSEVQNGSNWDRVFEKTFNIYNAHRFGVFNGFISASIRSSLFDSDPNLLSTTYMGMFYRVRSF
jgi:hypothetical protein